MPLTLNQFLFLVITIVVVATGTSLIILIFQLRKTANKSEEALADLRELLQNLSETSRTVNAKLEDVDDIVKATKKTARSLSEIAFFLTAKMIRPASKFWPFLYPALRIGWRQIKKRKEDKNGK